MLVVDNNYHVCTKHINIHYHFIHKCVAQKVIDLVYCPTDNRTADILTKALPQWKVACHSLELGLHHLSRGVQESGTDEGCTRQYWGGGH